MPRRPEKPLTEEEKFKLQEQQEQELGSLQRQYCILEKDRHLWGLKLGGLNKILNVYKKEHSNIQTDLEVAKSGIKKRQDRKDSEHISGLLEDYDFYQGEVNQERKYIQEIEGQIRAVEKEVVRLRTLQITDRQHEDRVWQAQKTIDALMNKLDVQNKKFGVLCAKNRNMKDEIRRLIWERDVFMKSWNKLINKLTLGKKFMMDLIDQATIAYDQREQWCSKLQALRIKAHNDLVLHTQEMRELKRKQDSQKKLEDFFNTKGQRRVMRDLFEKERIKRIEDKIKLEKKLEEYRNYLDDILEFTKESQIEVIAHKFYRQEAENFSLFIRVTELIRDLEFLNDDLGGLHEDIDAERQIEAVRGEKRKNTISNLEAELEKQTAELQEAENEIQELDKSLNEMMTGVGSLFKICKCNNDPILQLLGDNTKVNIYNVFIHIEMIEKAVNAAMVQVYNEEKIAYDKKKIGHNQRIVNDDKVDKDLKAVMEQTPCPLCVSHEIVSDVIDTLQHVMTRDKVKATVKQRLKTPEYIEMVHNVSKCFLPESREILQKRFE